MWILIKLVIPLHTMMANGWVILSADQWSGSHPGPFICRDRAPGTHWIRGWVGPSTIVDIWETRKTSLLLTARYQTSIPWSSSLYPSHYTNYSILAHLWVLKNSKNYTFQTGEYFISIKYMKQFILMYCK